MKLANTKNYSGKRLLTYVWVVLMIPELASPKGTLVPHMMLDGHPSWWLQDDTRYVTRHIREYEISDTKAFPTRSSEPRFYDVTSEKQRGSPLSKAFRISPKNVDNHLLFRYFFSPKNQQHQKFYDFVREWYPSACALVHYTSITHVVDPDQAHTLGSGSLTGETSVTTARHLLGDVDLDRLYARFSRYNVSYSFSHQIYSVQQYYLDVPVRGCAFHPRGVDEVKLFLAPTPYLNQYGRVLPTASNPWGNALPPGLYTMFHFAGGYPHVSVGDIPDLNGSNLHDNMYVQAGPGASGGPVLSYDVMNGNVRGHGFSVYRDITTGNACRRIVPFSGVTWKDPISSPYHYNPSFMAGTTHPLKENGWEYLLWQWSCVGQREQQKPLLDKPVGSLYRTNKAYPRGTRSMHHIISLDDMVHLWGYVEAVDDITKAKLEAQEACEQAYYAAKLEERSHPAYVKPRREKPLTPPTSFAVLKQRVLAKRYDRLKAHMLDLSPVLSPSEWPKDLTPEQKANPSLWAPRWAWCWSKWNLFEGWNSHHRTADPSTQTGRTLLTDMREPLPPLKFPSLLWKAVTALNESIQELKRLNPDDLDATEDAAIRKVETALLALKTAWVQWIGEPIHRTQEKDWKWKEPTTDGLGRYALGE